MKKILNININYLDSLLHKEFIKGMKDEYSMEVFVPSYYKREVVVESEDDVIVSKCFNKHDRLLFHLKQKKIYSALQREINIEMTDLVHASTLYTDGNIAYRIKKEYGIPYVVQVRNTDINTFFDKMILLRDLGVRIMEEADCICFFSTASKNVVLTKFTPLRLQDKIEKKTKVIPNGIDSFWFRNTPPQKKDINGTIRIVYAGMIDKNKNITTTQKAVENLVRHGKKTTFTVAGNPDNKRIFRRIQEDRNTRIIPWQTKEGLLKLYRSNDIFVMPSIHESFGLVYAEAMSQGLPVIYTRGQGFDEQFEDGKVGYSVNAKSYLEISNKLEMIMDHYTEMTDNCIKLSNKFRWESVCDEYKQIYDRILMLYK